MRFDFGLIQTMGWRWCARRAAYAAMCRMGRLEQSMPLKPWPRIAGRALRKALPVLHAEPGNDSCATVLSEADGILQGNYRFFFRRPIQCGFPPDWFRNPCAPPKIAAYEFGIHWSRLDEYSDGDIKGIWELGRFGFTFPLIRAYHLTGETKYLDGFWTLAQDFFEHNPPNSGPHWKCGQEVALRLIAWTFAWLAAPAGHTKVRENLFARLVEFSGERIAGNIRYALAQENNHGISEAAGLWTAGILLGENRWMERGRSLLNRQVAELVYADGGFSQHSVNYQRLMLDVCLWCIRFGRDTDHPFGPEFLNRIRVAGEYLQSLLDPATGRVPNYGNNDGGLVLPLTPCDFLDYRPVVQAVAVMTQGHRVLPPGAWDAEWQWLAGRKTDHQAAGLNLRNRFVQSGLAIWHTGRGRLVFRCPQRFRHRPAHCDGLHVDLWLDGVNVLRDGGTYSYNCDEPWQSYFKSVAAHNTIQFDDHDQMPSHGRFLLGQWIECRVSEDEDGNGVSAEYRDAHHCQHKRCVERNETGWRITDELSGYSSKAVLRWRLTPEWDWAQTSQGCCSEAFELAVISDRVVERRIVTGWESLYYQELKEIPVLEVEVAPGASKLVSYLLTRKPVPCN